MYILGCEWVRVQVGGSPDLGEEGSVKGFGDEEAGDTVSAWEIRGDEEADFWEVKRTDDGGGCRADFGVFVVVVVAVGRLLKIHCCISPDVGCVVCRTRFWVGKREGGGKKGKRRHGRASRFDWSNKIMSQCTNG